MGIPGPRRERSSFWRAGVQNEIRFMRNPIDDANTLTFAGGPDARHPSGDIAADPVEREAWTGVGSPSQRALSCSATNLE